jgi:Mor family transcriptional regulator
LQYKNAQEILPHELLREVQKYVQGAQLYIPRAPGRRAGWGERNGERGRLFDRNLEIRHRYDRGMSVDDLADEYALSPDSIRKIIYQRPRVFHPAHMMESSFRGN